MACGSTMCTRCGTETGSLPLFAVCSEPSDCQSGVCDGSKHCTMACETAADCTAAVGANGICTELVVTDGGTQVHRIGVCDLGCERTADCAATGGVCTTVSNYTYNRHDLVCRPPFTGQGVIGASCSSANDCVSRMCVSLSGQPRCSELCKTDGDCQSPLTHCGTAEMALPGGGGTMTVKIC